MLTKEQKVKAVKTSAEAIRASRNLVFADFTGAPVTEVNKLKRSLKAAGATFTVVKKRLLSIAMRQAGIDFDPTQFEAQVGTVFVSGELTSVASAIYKFAKDLEKKKKHFNVLGAYDVPMKSFIDAKQFVVIAKLPTREILIAMIMGGITGPVRAFMSIVDQLSKRVVANNTNPANNANQSQTVESKT